MDPLIERAVDAAALGFILDDHETDEVASRLEARAHRVVAREHAIEGEGHVVSLEELGDGEHSGGFMGLAFAFRLPAFGFRNEGAHFASRDSRGGSRYVSRGASKFFGYGEDAG